MARLHAKKIPGVSYSRQGYIFFTCLEYKSLAQERKQAIRDYCDTFGDNSELMFEFCTSDKKQEFLCSKYFVSQRTLSRLVFRFYQNFPKNI